MEPNLKNATATGILILNIKVLELAPLTSAIMKVSVRGLSWADVSARLIEEVADLRCVSDSNFKADTAGLKCQICLRTSYSMKKCFLNPTNPYKKLQLLTRTVQQILTPPKRRTDKG